MWVAFALQKLLTFLQQKYQCICHISIRNFNVTLAINFVKFWTTGPWRFKSETCFVVHSFHFQNIIKLVISSCSPALMFWFYSEDEGMDWLTSDTAYPHQHAIVSAHALQKPGAYHYKPIILYACLSYKPIIVYACFMHGERIHWI